MMRESDGRHEWSIRMTAVLPLRRRPNSATPTPPFSCGYFILSALFVIGSSLQRVDKGTAASLSPNGTTSALS